ncbi:MAG: autotransporter outer membrane beta-barrel domain-containing protein [Parvibaculales bacterium]
MNQNCTFGSSSSGAARNPQTITTPPSSITTGRVYTYNGRYYLFGGQENQASPPTFLTQAVYLDLVKTGYDDPRATSSGGNISLYLGDVISGNSIGTAISCTEETLTGSNSGVNPGKIALTAWDHLIVLDQHASSATLFLQGVSATANTATKDKPLLAVINFAIQKFTIPGNTKSVSNDAINLVNTQGRGPLDLILYPTNNHTINTVRRAVVATSGGDMNIRMYNGVITTASAAGTYNAFILQSNTPSDSSTAPNSTRINIELHGGTVNANGHAVRLTINTTESRSVSIYLNNTINVGNKGVYMTAINNANISLINLTVGPNANITATNEDVHFFLHSSVSVGGISILNMSDSFGSMNIPFTRYAETIINTADWVVSSAVNLLAGNDSLANELTMTLSDSIDFGVHSDNFVNNGMLTITGTQELMGLEEFVSDGIIIMSLDFANPTTPRLSLDNTVKSFTLSGGMLDIALEGVTVPEGAGSASYYLVELKSGTATFSISEDFVLLAADAAALGMNNPVFSIMDVGGSRFLVLSSVNKTLGDGLGELPRQEERGRYSSFVNYLENLDEATLITNHLNQLVQADNPANYQAGLRRLSPDIYGHLINASLSAIEDVDAHSDNAQCNNRLPFADGAGEKCFWQQVTRRAENYGRSPKAEGGADIKSTDYAAGGYFPIRNNALTRMNTALIYQRNKMTTENATASSGRVMVQLGISRKLGNQRKPTRFKADLLIGSGDDTISRDVKVDGISDVVSSDFRQTFIALRSGIHSKKRLRNNMQLLQSLGVGITYLQTAASSEKGNVAALHLEGYRKTFYTLAGSFGLSGQLGGGQGRVAFLPYFEVGFIYYLDNPAPVLSARFDNVEGGKFSFASAKDDIVVNAQFGVNVVSGKASKLNFSYRVKNASEEALSSQSFSLSFKQRF